jgi:hypothetical protein
MDLTMPMLAQLSGQPLRGLSHGKWELGMCIPDQIILT